MASEKDISARQKHHLASLLKIKKADMSNAVEMQAVLAGELVRAVAVMDKEDVEWVENVLGIKAL